MRKFFLPLLGALCLAFLPLTAADPAPAAASAAAPAQVNNFAEAVPMTKVPRIVLPPDEEVIADQTLWDTLKSTFHTNFIAANRWSYLFNGFATTMEISVFAALLGIVIGFIVAPIRNIADQTGNLKFLNGLAKVYLTVIRGTPVVVQLLIIYFVIFGALDVNKVLVAIIAFGVNSGAYVTEIVRSGINAVDPGQMEAARSLGLSRLQSMRLVVMPQALKNILPALGNEFIALLKETSISGYIALLDLTKGGDIIRSQTYDAFMPLMAVALIYLAVVMLFTKLLAILERSMKKNER